MKLKFLFMFMYLITSMIFLLKAAISNSVIVSLIYIVLNIFAFLLFDYLTKNNVDLISLEKKQ